MGVDKKIKMGKATPYQGSAPENDSGKLAEFPTKKPDNFPQLKYDGLYRKYCRILQSTAFRQGKNSKKKEAKRNKQLNAIIEMVTMSDKNSLALRQENNMTDDKEIEREEERVSEDETLNSGEDLKVTKESDKPKSMPISMKKEETE